MYSKVILIYLVIGSAFWSGCATTEKIGDYKYKTKMERVNTGDFGGIIVTIKSYYLKNEFQAGCIVKSQLLYHENKTDTIYSSGFTVIDHITNELKCYEFNNYRYKNFADDTYRSFIQTKDGHLKLNEIKTIKMEEKTNNNIWDGKNLPALISRDEAN